MRFIPVLLLAAMAASSCGPAKKTAGTNPVTEEIPQAPVTTTATPTTDGNIMKKPDVDMNKVNFAMRFLKTSLQGSPRGNTVLSPYSAGMAFSMLTDGAAGETRNGLVAALARSSYYGDFPYADSLNIVETANSVWLGKGFRAKETYVNTLKNGYAAQVFSADAGDPFTADAVNAWCSKHTNGLIPQVLDELRADTRMLLLNALYFKAPWLIPFAPEDTGKDVFHGEGGDVQADFMHKTSRSYRYCLAPGCTFVSLPYKNSRYAMLVAIPDNMDAAIDRIDMGAFQNALSLLYSGDEVVLSMPKFKVEYTRVLNDVMSELGADAALSPSADFTGITDESVCVTKAIQKCVLEVNEEGAEAAAVTAVKVGLTSVAVRRPPIVIKVDKPFLFAIYDTKTQNILFEGKIADIK